MQRNIELTFVACVHRDLHGCLQQTLHIPPAFLSRTSTARVFAHAAVVPFTQTLLQRQLVLLSKAARSKADHPLRLDTFGSNGCNP